MKEGLTPYPAQPTKQGTYLMLMWFAIIIKKNAKLVLALPISPSLLHLSPHLLCCSLSLSPPETRSFLFKFWFFSFRRAIESSRCVEIGSATVFQGDCFRTLRPWHLVHFSNVHFVVFLKVTCCYFTSLTYTYYLNEYCCFNWRGGQCFAGAW